LPATTPRPRCCVVDIAQALDGDLKAVECNAITASGLYICEAGALVAALRR